MSQQDDALPDPDREPDSHAPPVSFARRWLARITSTLVFLLAAPLLLATLLSYLAPVAWWLDLLTHFRPHYAMGLLIATLLQLLVRPRALAGAWAAAALLNVLMIGPMYVSRLPPAAGPELTVVHANVAGDDVDVKALAAWILAAEPDLISLQEITPTNLPRIERVLLQAGLAYHTAAAQPRDDTRGVALLSRRDDITATVIYPTPDGDRPMVQALLDLGGVQVAVLGFHTTRPAPARPYRFQAQGMSAANLWCRVQRLGGAEQLLIGDFNSTSQGVLVSDLCRRAGLRDARRGHGMAGTWPASLPAPLRIPIDGAFHTEGLVTTSLETGPFVGSDHLPLLVTLRPRAPGARDALP